MDTPKIFESEYRFCLILWENEPINSTKLAKLCNERLGWSRTTTYTVIKRLSERGVVKNENAVVTSLVSKEEVQQAEIDEMIEKTLDASRFFWSDCRSYLQLFSLLTIDTNTNQVIFTLT